MNSASPSQPVKPIPPNKPVHEMSLRELKDYQEQLQAYQKALEQKVRMSRERERIRRMRVKYQQTSTSSAFHKVRQQIRDLDAVMVNQALKMVNAETASEPRHSDASGSAGSDYESYFVEYEIDAPAAITNKPPKRIKVHTHRGVFDLIQQVQDLDQMLIDDVVRMTGKPFSK